MSSQAIVFIPGIKGTKLVDTNRASFDVIWSGFQSEFESIQDLELTSEYQNAYYDEDPTTIIKAGEIETLAYGEFIRDLKTKKPIYIFNYDWRMSAVENGRKLDAFVEYLIRKSHASSRAKDKIKTLDFVTHSLGNVVLRCYLKQAGMGKVNKIVFTVPPFDGSLDIVLTVLVGEGFLPGTKEKIRKLIRTYPGALELLPIYERAAFFVGEGDAVGADVDFFNPDDWQDNITKTDWDKSRERKRELAGKFKAALAVASATVKQQALDLATLSDDERSRILIIARTGYKTLQSLRVYPQKPRQPGNLFDLSKALRTEDGDGRVPDVSSCRYHETVLTLMLTNHWYYREHGHAFILKDERVQRLISRFLSKDGLDHRIPGNSVRRVTGLRKSAVKKGNWKGHTLRTAKLQA